MTNDEKNELTADDVRELVRQKFGTKRGALTRASLKSGADLARIYHFMNETPMGKNPPVALLNYLDIKAEVVYRRKGKSVK